MEILVLNYMIIHFHLSIRICNWGLRFITYVSGEGFRFTLNPSMSIPGYFYMRWYSVGANFLVVNFYFQGSSKPAACNKKTGLYHSRRKL